MIEIYIDTVSSYPSINTRGRPKLYRSDEDWKEAKREIARETYRRNAEQIKEATRIYKAANIDKIREKQREIYNRIKDKMKTERLINKILSSIDTNILVFSDEDKAKLLEMLNN